MRPGNKNINIVRHVGLITKADRNRLNRHDSGVIWFTGLSASGKSTIAHETEKRLFENRVRVYVFDGDNVRHGLNSDLGFSVQHRRENIRRIVEVAKLFVDAGFIVLTAFITPFEEQRKFVRKQFEGTKFLEVYVKCDVEECTRRDPKGLYKKALAGKIESYTGVSSPFEVPQNPDVILNTQKLSVEESEDRLLEFLRESKFLDVK
ncbi:MAG: adenylyl-sulfate kinase [Nitrospirota bacterium]